MQCVSGVAMMIIEEMLTEIVSNFEVRREPAYAHQFIQAPTLRFVNGLLLRISPRVTEI